MLILYVAYTCFLDHKYTNIFVYILYVGKRFICELRMRETVAAESCPLFRVLRHRTPSSPICLSEVIHKPFALSRVFLLSSGGKSVLLVKKKAPSHSGFPASMHVVLKTRHVNLNIHVRRYYSHVRSPNLSATRPQLLSLRRATN